MAASTLFSEGQSVFLLNSKGTSWATVLAAVHYMDTDQIWVRVNDENPILISQRTLIPAAIGRTLEMTWRAWESLKHSGQDIRLLLEIHARGHDFNLETTASNAKALTEGGLVFTGHQIDQVGVIFIATTSDRLRTAIFTPSDPARYRHPLMP